MNPLTLPESAPALRKPESAQAPTIAEAGAMPVAQALAAMATTEAGLTAAHAAQRLRQYGPNAIHTHRATLLPVLLRQLRSPLLLLLAVTAVVSFFVGERSDAVIIGAILTVSIGLGAFNEFRAERAAEAL